MVSTCKEGLWGYKEDVKVNHYTQARGPVD